MTASLLLFNRDLRVHDHVALREAAAAGREHRLAVACGRERLALHLQPGSTVVPPAMLTPAGGDHFKVFSPYHRAWSAVEIEPALDPPKRLSAPRAWAACGCRRSAS